MHVIMTYFINPPDIFFLLDSCTWIMVQKTTGFCCLVQGYLNMELITDAEVMDDCSTKYTVERKVMALLAISWFSA